MGQNTYVEMREMSPKIVGINFQLKDWLINKYSVCNYIGGFVYP